MKKFLILVVVAVAAICLVAGCAGEVKTYNGSGQAVSIGVNEEFLIVLDSNPTTGYEWEDSYDGSMLELIEKTYEPGESAKQGAIGAGGVEYFRFKALKEGETEITMTYKRSWEEEFAEKRVYEVSIK